MKKTISLCILMVLFLVVSLASAPVFGAGEEGLEKADQAREKHTDELMSIKGVVGVALGLNPAGRGAVLVFTKEAGVTGIPGTLDEDVPVRVQDRYLKPAILRFGRD